MTDKTKFTREDYVHLVEEAYFGNVVSGNLPGILDCFTEDVHVTIRHGDNPIRQFTMEGRDGTSRLEDFYRHLCGNFKPWFGEFEHYIDLPAQRCASTFVVKLSPLEDSDYLEAGPQTLRNCNFFKCRDGSIEEMIIYYSNTESGMTQTPTGYPKQGWQAEG